MSITVIKPRKDFIRRSSILQGTLLSKVGNSFRMKRGEISKRVSHSLLRILNGNGTDLILGAILAQISKGKWEIVGRSEDGKQRRYIVTRSGKKFNIFKSIFIRQDNKKKYSWLVKWTCPKCGFELIESTGLNRREELSPTKLAIATLHTNEHLLVD